MNAEWFAPRPMTSKALQMPRAENLGAKQNGARSGGRTGRLLVRSAWGNPGPQGGRAGFQRTGRPLRFWGRKMGATPPIRKCESRIHSRQKRISRGGTNRFSLKPRVVLSQFLPWLHDRLAQTPQKAPAKNGSP